MATNKIPIRIQKTITIEFNVGTSRNRGCFFEADFLTVVFFVFFLAAIGQVILSYIKLIDFRWVLSTDTKQYAMDKTVLDKK